MATLYGHHQSDDRAFVKRVHRLKDEQERVQKKTFTNWMNTYLCKRRPPIKVDDLFEEIKDGTVLLSLLEVLSGDKLPMEKGTKLRRPHHIANITTALNYLQQRHIKLVNVNATSVADGKPSIVLGLVWTIILYFQIEETISQVPNAPEMDGDGPSSKKKAALPKQSLLAWAESVLAKKYGLTIKDFGKSWKNGVAFNAMIHNIRPDLVDMDNVRQQQARINLEHAFSTAEDQLGIARLLDPEDVDVDRPDEKSIMTYVAQFLKAYPDAGDPNFRGLPGDDLSTGEKEHQVYSSIMTWLNTDAADLLASSHDPVTDRQAELMDYIGFKTELDRREPIYKKIGAKVVSGQALKLTAQDWEALDSRWKEVEDETRRWLLKLDSHLPGKLGQFGQWLYEAEMKLTMERDLLASSEDSLPQMAETLRQHKEFFKDMESWHQFFLQTKRAGRCEGELLHGPHMDLMSKRLEAVSGGASHNQKRMEYLLCRFDVLGYIEAAEGKVATWSAKCGRQEDVESTLQDFVDVVERKQLVQNFEKTQAELKNLSETFKKLDKDEAPKVDAFQTEAAERWKKVASEIHSVKPSLEEVIKSWKSYNAYVDVLTVWLADGDQVLASGTPEDVEEFFKDLNQYEDRLRTLNDSGEFLLGVVTDPVAEEIKERLEEMNVQIPDLIGSFEQFRETEVVGRARTEYDEGVEHIEKWLNTAQDILNEQIPCVHAALKEHLLQLDELNNELVQVESDFKVTTKTAQSLVKDSSQELVTIMLETLNKEKEVIVRLRKEVPERIKYLKAVLPNVESLETGVLDLENWLAYGEQLLASHKLDSTAEASEARLDRHKTFFAETTYQKSILESKNKVFQKIGSTKPKLKNIDFSPTDDLMNSVNSRFQECLTSSKDWEKKLEGIARLWKSLLQRQQQLTEWLDAAQLVIDDSEDDPESLIRKHKSFFERADQKRLQEYLSNGQEILKQLEPVDQSPLEDTLTNMEQRWKGVMAAAPIRLLKLEFVLPEEKFDKHMNKAEQTLQHSQQQLAANVNVREALQKHRQFFEQGTFRSTCEKSLEQMKDYASQLSGLDPSDDSLEERYQQQLDRWKRLMGLADKLQLDLKQLPERWKDYNQKVQGLSEWTNNVEKLMHNMGQENISGDEYKDMLAKFQKEMRSMDKHMEEGRRLEANLEELLQDAPDSDGTAERQRLQELMVRFGGLRPNMEATMGKSSIFTKSYDFRDSADRRSHWLDEAQRLAIEDPVIDSLDEARAYLQEHEALLTKLESEKANIQKDIEQGKRLEQERNAPAFITQTVAGLERKWRDTNELSQAKHVKLKEKVKDWEQYEGEKASLLQYLKKAEAELERPQETLAQETAQKELQSKQELQSTLNKLKGSVGQMTKLNAVLCEGASRERQGPLKGEMKDIDRRLDGVADRLNAKLADLEMAIAKWNEYYKCLNNFCDWLNQEEAKLNEVLENKEDSPEEQLRKSEDISNQVLENHITLENLEKDAKDLTQNFRSRETTALKSKLTSVRRQWEGLCSRAKDRSTALSGNVAHWQRYQTLQEQLIPWIEKAEKYCATDLPKCSSLEEAKDLYDLHQAFLRECEENLPIFDKMSTEAGYLMDQPNMARDLESIQKRWSGILSSSEDRSHGLEKMLGAWSAYTSELENFQDNLDRLQSRLASDPNVGTTDVQVLEHELALAKTLQEEVRSQQPHLNALQRQFEQLAPHASPEGLQVLKSKQDSVRGSFEDASASVAERQRTLASALQHRRDFYGRLDDMETWVKKMQRKLDSGSEIYSDEVGDTLAKLKALRKECGEQDPAFQALQQEFKDLIQNCSEEERDVLMDHFDKLLDGYTRMEDLIGEREDLCQQWSQYSDAHKDAQAKLKSLQARLAAPDIKEEEVAQIMAEMGDLRKSLSPWSQEAEALDEKMSSAQMVIKDRASQRSLHFGSELQALEHLCDMVGQTAAQKEEHLGEVQQLRTDFEARQDSLRSTLQQLQHRMGSTQAQTSSLQGVRDLVTEIEDIRDDVFASNPEYEQLRELGRQIMHTDPLKAGEIQAQLAQVSELWEGVQSKLGEQHQYYNNVANQWQAYNHIPHHATPYHTHITYSDFSLQVSELWEGVQSKLGEQHQYYNNVANQWQAYNHIPHHATPYHTHITYSDFSLQVSELWEGVQSKLGEQHQYYNNVANQWQAYNDAKRGVGRVLEAVTPLVEQNIAFSTQNDVRRALEQHKNGEFELHANQSQLDHMNTKGMQLLEELRKIPNFDPSVMENDLDEVNLQWENANKAIEDHKETLEAQLVCWDQVVTGREEVGVWINSMLSKLDDSTRHFDDAVTVESRLNKFREEAPYYTEVMSEVAQKINDLRELNQGQSIPALESAQREMEEKFEHANTLANQLSATMADFSQEQQDLQQSMQEETEWLNQLKDLLSRCDDLSGEDEDIITRLSECKALQEDLASHKKKVNAVQDKTAALLSKYPSVEMSSLAKDANVLAKKLESMESRAERIEDTLMGALEQHCLDAQQQQERWLAAAKEKVTWCGDLGGDRYSVEAKLSTMKDLSKSMEEGEEKRAEAQARLEAARSVLPHARLTDLEQRSKHLEKDWSLLLGQMDQTQDKLEGSVQQWEAYDSQHDALSQWLRDTEARLRGEATLRPDLAAKEKQLDFFKDLEGSVLSRQKEFDDMRDMAQKISHSSGDTRTASYANQLVSRFQTLASAVKEQVEQCEKRVEDHENFAQRHRACVDWMKEAQIRLDSCSQVVGDEDSLNAQLDIVKDLLAEKEQGLGLFNAALESGERLYPNTSNEGREEVRRELRTMRDSWENFNDSLNETQRALESSRMQWSTFDENFEQLVQWVNDVESQVGVEPDLQATLQEKKAQLQSLKARSQDILSHQSMLDSISDKGTALGSSQAQNRIRQLNSKYNALCSKAQAQVRHAESAVERHQALQDSTQACRDWMSVAQDRLAVCAETGGDRQSLTNRLDRLQDLINSQSEGQAKLKVAQQDSDKTLPQTSVTGQTNIQGEMATLQQEWDSLASRMTSTQQSLQTAVQAMETYDSSCEALSRWIRDVESQLKDYDMKSTLPEKQAQVEKFESVQQQITSKQSQFDDLQTMVAQVQGSDTRLHNYNSQLMSRYEAVKNTAKDVIGRWQEFVDDHVAYQNNYTQCSEWVAALQKRLQICGDLAGDRQDVEERVAKLQEVIAEKEEGFNLIHQTVETGERLYPNTAAEGRDIIRQELRSLREQWDQIGDEVGETQRKLDGTLTQWSSYEENFDTFQKWILDVEGKLEQDAELKATLPEKKAQLQNHKVLHQDILSRKHIIENLSEKAQGLSRATPSAKVSKVVGELQGKYDKICSLSRSVLDQLDQAVKDHQQYQDSSHDFQDWLNAAREKLDMCVDRSGDKMSLQAKRERLKEFSTGLTEGEGKLKSVKDLATKTSTNTSRQGQEVLHREVEHLQREWEDYRGRLSWSEQALEQTMEQWGSFEGLFEECSKWLKTIESSIKNQELKNTLEEKQAQVDTLKKQREEILSHQAMIDRFTDEAQNLMHTSSDVRLSTQVTQLTTRYQGLLSLTKELISKWEKYVSDHQVFNSRLSEYNDWVQQASQKLDQCSQSVGDQESMEEKRALIQLLLSEKEHGLQRLNGSVESGEKLYPDTAAAGREKIRQDLRSAKEDWERLFSGLNEAQRRVDAFLMQWASYVDGQDSLSRWMAETEAALRTDMELRNTLQEKRQQLQNYRSVLQDITSHQRLVDSVVEKAQSVLQSTSNPDVASFITTINSRYEKLASDAKTLIGRSEQHVTTHQQYQESQQAAVDWLSQMKDKLSLCSDSTGDRTTISNKLDRLQDLMNQLGEGQTKVKDCERHAQDTMDTTAPKGRQTLQSEMDVLKLDWEDYSHKLHSLKDSLEQALHYWRIYEEKYERIQGWIKTMEKQVKDCSLKSTLEEKQQQLKKYQELAEEISEQETAVVDGSRLEELEFELLQEMKGQQGDMDKFTDEAQTLQQLTSESRVGNFVSQLSARYQGLLVTTKEIIKRCEQNVEDHKSFVGKFADASQWLIKAKEKFATCSDTAGSRTELEDRLDSMQELVRDRDAGLLKLNNCVESGERLYASTAPEGREIIRQELRKLKLGWDSLYDDLSAVQRRLEVSLVQWTSFNESYSQVENWLRDMEGQLEGQIPLRSTLEEKKTQHQNFKVLLQDVESYKRVIDSISDKAENLVHASSDPQLSHFISTATARYQKLCTAAKDRVQQYEQIVTEHQEYNDSYNTCVEWLNTAREKLSACSDVSGDRHAIQGRLDKIQDILATKMEGEPKVQNVVSLAQNVLPKTAPQGRDVIVRDTQALRADWEAFMLALAKTKTDLESCMDQWKEFESYQDKCAHWLKDIEARLRDVDLKAALPEKQIQLEKLKVLQKEINEHEQDLDVLSDLAQELMQVSADSRVVSQASQLATRFQTAVINTKELCRRWEQYVADHRSYLEAVEGCHTWLTDMEARVSSVLDTSGDKTTVQDRLSNVQALLSEKEEGLHKLQMALDSLQMALPNTSVSGRDAMRRDMQALQQDYDALSGRLMEARSSQEGMLAQWTVYDDGVGQLVHWLQDLEKQVDAEEGQQQNTMQEKKLQLERVKVLRLNIQSQQSTIDNLDEKAQTLIRSSRDGNLGKQIIDVVNRYEVLCEKGKTLQEQCEKNLRDHQVYRDTYMVASEWLGAATEKLNICSDVRGDRSALEAQLHKVEEISSSEAAGRQKLREAEDKGSVVLPQTSHQGQELVKEELTMLRADFDAFRSDLTALSNSLGTLLDQWQRYEAFYEEVNQWIKDTETDMKSDSELKATLEQKAVQLEKQKSLHEELVQQQDSLDKLTEQAQVLMQSSTDSRVATQLSHISARYTALLTVSKDLLKRYEQTTQDHQQYSEVYSQTRSWLQDTYDKLAVCSDTSGDKFTIQTQLEKLQEFVVMKEEGQVLIHTTNTWGEKTMTNTAAEGREVIRQELQQLQTDWEHMLSHVTDTKVMLESCVMQWTDFSASHNQVTRWLKDMEKRLRDTHFKADLSEKKAELQRCKTMYQDIVSYEQMIESMTDKATGLVEKSPASKVNTDTSGVTARYIAVKEQAKELLAKNEQYVAQHQTFHDCCNSFVNWLRTAVEKLATCSDTYGEKSAIETKLERAKALMQSLEEGNQRLDQATMAGDTTLPSTSASGQTKIRQELQIMARDFEDFRVHLMEAQQDMENCLERWNEYEESYQKFSAWLREAELQLRAETEHTATVEEKKHHWDDCQNQLEELTSQQPFLDDVSEKAQALLQTNADAKTSHAITQLNTRYQAVIALAKDLCSSLESAYNHHRLYKHHHQQFSDWLKQTKQHIKDVQDVRGSKDNVNSRLLNLHATQAALDHGHSLLRSLMDSAEKTLPSTSVKGCQVIRQETDAAKTDYEDILTELSQVKRNLEAALSHWDDYDCLYQQLVDWVTDTEGRLASDPELKADLPEKRSSLEKYKALQTDIASHKDLIDRLNEKAEHVKDGVPRSHVSEMQTRYAKLQQSCKDQVGKVEDTSTIGEWLLTVLQDQVGKVEDTGTIGEWLLTVLQDQVGKVEDTSTIGEWLLTVLQDQVGKVEDTSTIGEWLLTVLHDQVGKVEDTGTIGEWLLTVLQDQVGKVEDTSTIGEWLLTVLQDQDQVWKVEDTGTIGEWLLTVLQDQVGKVEDTGTIGEWLLTEDTGTVGEWLLTEDTGTVGEWLLTVLRDQVGKVEDTGTVGEWLLTVLQDQVRKVEDQVKSHEEYRKAYITSLDWLANAKHRLQRLSDFSGDKHSLQDRLQQLRDFKAELSQGQEMVDRCAALGERNCHTTAPRGVKAIRREVQSLRDDWASFTTSVADVESNLESCIANWLKLDDEHTGFMGWLQSMDAKVKALAEHCSSLPAKRKRLQEGQDLYDEIVRHRGELDKVRDKGDSIVQRSSDPRLSNSMMQLYTKYQALNTSAKSMLSRLKENVEHHTLYDDALDNAQRWMSSMTKRVAACSDTAGDWQLIQDRIEDIKDVTACMDDGLAKVNCVCDQAEKIILTTSGEGKNLIEQQAVDLNQEWETLNKQIRSCTEMLEGMQHRWHEYEQYYGSLVRWLNDTEDALRSGAEPKALLIERKAQLDKFKLILSDVENHRRLVNELSDRGANLEALCDNVDVSASLDDLQARFDALLYRAKDMVEEQQRLYDEHMEFHEAQQDCEKWLLQMSFRLMSNNSLNVSTMELTERQIDKHRTLIREIEDYGMTVSGVTRLGQQVMQHSVRVPRLVETVQAQLENLQDSYSSLQATASQIRDRLKEILSKWQWYKELLESTQTYLTTTFPQWLQEAQAHLPDSFLHAQQQREDSQAGLEKLYSMREELQQAAQRCNNMGSMESLDKLDTATESCALDQFAEQVHTTLTDCISQVEKRLERLRDTVQQWEHVDRTRAELRQWLQGRQEELQDMETSPAKLHAEAADLDIQKLQRFLEDVTSRGPAMEDLISQYRTLTQHNPSLADPVVMGVKGDWEALVEQIQALLSAREEAHRSALDLQTMQSSIDQDLEDYARQLERIDKEESTMQEKGVQMQTRRRRCRGTQTSGDVRQSIESSEGDDPDFQWRANRGPRRARAPFTSPRLRRSRSGNLARANTPSLPPDHPSHPRRSQDYHEFRKGAAAAAAAAGLESEREESGYVETYGETMHASSFDTHLDASYWMGSEAGKDTPGNVFYESDDESAASYITGIFLPVDPESLHDATSQTPGYAKVQTIDLPPTANRSHQTQTAAHPQNASMQTSTTSLHSIGAQTQGRSGSRADLLKSILVEVKGIKEQQGVDGSDGDSVASDATIRKETLERLHRNVTALRHAGVRGNATTQTVQEQTTQTTTRMFPGADPQQQARQERLQGTIAEIKSLRTETSDSNHTPSRAHSTPHSMTDFDQRTASRSAARTTTPMRFESSVSSPAPELRVNHLPPPSPVVNGYNGVHFAPDMAGLPYGHRRVTRDELNSLSDRLDRLHNYQMAPRRQMPVHPAPMQPPPLPPPPPPPPQLPPPPPPPQPVMYMPPPPLTPPPPPPLPQPHLCRRYQIREFSRSYDDIDVMLDGGGRRGGGDGVRGRYHLDGALDDATDASRELRRVSSRMRRDLRDELGRHGY
ncbi:hypothetical protein ACOMHN_006396 [Nucella lapillus]